jgi:uncharacterized Zn finger protein (UPF0148 family)
LNNVKKIQCSSCGATSVFKLHDDVYKCNYCQTEFKVEANNAKTQNELRSALHQLKKQTAENAMLNPAKAKRMGCFIVVMVLVMVMGIIATVLFKVRKQAGAGFNSIMSGWQAPTINKYAAFTGSRGPVIWEILESSRTILDSAKHTLRIIDPKRNKLLIEKPFGEITTWSDNFNWRKRFDDEFLIVNDTLYNGSEEGGLQAFNLYTGEKILSNNYFEKKFPELKDGISKVESRLYNKQFVLYTNSGDEFYYFPLRKKIRDKNAEDNAYKTDTITQRNFYISDNKKCALYLVTQKENFNQDAEISESEVKNYNDGDYYTRKEYKSIKRIGDQYYPCAQRLISNSNFVVLAYLSDFSKKAKLIIEKIDANGGSVWRNQDTAFKPFIEDFSSDNLYLHYQYSPKEIVFHNTGAVHRSLGVDLNSGKTTFVHTQGYQID